ncbi:MAG: hypothetical protein K2P88_17840 [Chitinophagaceae bacterium]|uniref:hypothetical protein n=1 Tax=unclassified Paraflavitalea TaxID=2798305 RepID=UPI003D34D64E|nr:hypothetical protein [Chitinophagaceae bacterium]
MKAIFLTITLFTCLFNCYSQLDLNGKDKSISRAYKYKMTIVVWGLEKISRMKVEAAAINKKEGVTDYSGFLKQHQYDSLTVRQKFTYAMMYPETFAQICSISLETESEDKIIKFYLPRLSGDFQLSQRQRNFLIRNKDSVSFYIKELTQLNHQMGLNLKNAIAIANITELIPLIISEYRANTHDHYLLTLLIHLMEQNKSPEFLESSFFKEVAKNGSYYNASVAYTASNVEYVISSALKFYYAQNKK